MSASPGINPPKSKRPFAPPPTRELPPDLDEPERAEPALPEAEQLTAVTFLHPELIAGKSSVSIRKKDCLSIEPAVMTSSGRFVPPADGEASTGVLIRLRVTQDATPREYVARKFVPWANIGLVEFGL